MPHWLSDIEDLGSGPLTVQAQALSVDDIDPARTLSFPALFPVTDVDSVKIEHIFEMDVRYAASRREWNLDGKEIPGDSPTVTQLEMVPLEAQMTIGEREMQKIVEQAVGNQALYKELAAKTIPARVNGLVETLFRGNEVEAMEAWSKGQITSYNPIGGSSHVMSFGYAAGRFQTAGTAWNNGGTNAWTELMSWIADGESEMGQIVGVRLRRATFNAIQVDAPYFGTASSGYYPSKGNMERLIADELGHPFTFVIDERSYDKFTDGGKAVTRTNIWPAQYVCAIPAGGVIGRTYAAPVVRAAELAAEFPDYGIDVRGVTVFYGDESNSKKAVIQAQANWMTVPSERLCWSIDAGV